jgi:cell division cycle 2-like protein
MQQLLSALAHIHSNWFFHRDIKTANVLYNNGHVALADFGMARKYDEPLRKYTQLVVTLHYRSPELLLGEDSYSPAVDMWSMGCLMGELLTGSALMPGQGEVDQLTRIVKLRGRPDPTGWPQVAKLPHFNMLAMTPSKQATSLAAMFARKDVRAADGPFLCDRGLDLLERMLALNPAERLTAEEALAHPWFSAAPLARALVDMPSGLDSRRTG